MREVPAAGGGSALVHESSYVDAGATIGQGTRVWHFCHVMAGAVIGEQCSLGQNVVVMPRVTLGRNVKVQNNVSLYEGVRCEDDVFLGPSMVFTNVLNPRSHVSRKHAYRDTIVRRGASIGANATIVCGRRRHRAARARLTVGRQPSVQGSGSSSAERKRVWLMPQADAPTTTLSCSKV